MVADPGGIAVLNSLYGYNSMQKVDPNFYDPFLQLMVKAGADPSQFVK
jgi:hypothetical protein